jgi:ATP-dependent Clp protease protease subunit
MAKKDELPMPLTLGAIWSGFAGKYADVERNWPMPGSMGEWGALMQITERRVFLFTEIIDEDKDDEVQSIGWLIKGLYTLDSMGTDPITMYINSPGGDIAAGLALVNVMLDLRSPVFTFVVGQASSMAAVVAVAGAKRKAYPTARWLLHRGKSSAQGDAEDLAIEAKEFRTLDSYADQVVINASAGKIDHKKLGRLQRKNYYMSAEEAKKVGLLDEIVMPSQWADKVWIPPKGSTTYESEEETHE